jgi:hypothetical protein
MHDLVYDENFALLGYYSAGIGNFYEVPEDDTIVSKHVGAW